MRITRVSFGVAPAMQSKPGNRLLELASVDIDGQLRIESIRVVKAWDGRILVCMPNMRDNAGAWKDVVHPITHELRDLINEAILIEMRNPTRIKYGD